MVKEIYKGKIYAITDNVIVPEVTRALRVIYEHLGISGEICKIPENVIIQEVRVRIEEIDYIIVNGIEIHDNKNTDLIKLNQALKVKDKHETVDSALYFVKQ
ncbi:hypothetical protein HS7_13660 [Sulfolobales archaeon HS-7]|nr:hypothetical protein HS7_13660 [Sulfolobales archaeon HS-7]